jgi:hypothetical protein
MAYVNRQTLLRPIIDDSVLDNTSANGIANAPIYFYGENYYVGYPHSTFWGHRLIVRKRGGAEKEYSMETALAGADYYFNQELEHNGYGLTREAGEKQMIEGDIFTIRCVAQSDGTGLPEQGRTDVRIRINLATGAVSVSGIS